MSNFFCNKHPSSGSLFGKFIALVAIYLYMGIAAHECIWTYIGERDGHYYRNYFVAIKDGFHGSYHDFVTDYYYNNLWEAVIITAIFIAALIAIMALIRVTLTAIDKAIKFLTAYIF